MSFADNQGGDADEWVETHAGRKSNVDSTVVGDIDDIPDLDGQDQEDVATGMSALTLGSSSGAVAADTPDLDDIPDMEEDDIEEKDEATAVATPAGVIDSR